MLAEGGLGYVLDEALADFEELMSATAWGRQGSEALYNGVDNYIANYQEWSEPHDCII